MIKYVLQKMGYDDIIRQEKNYKSIKYKKQDINFKLFIFGMLGLIFLSSLGGAFISNAFFYIYGLIIPFFAYYVQKDFCINERYKIEITQLHLDFF